MADNLHKRIHDATQSVNAQVLDRAIRHSVFLERLKTGEVNDVVKFLNRDVFPDILDKLQVRLRRIEARGIDSGAWTTKNMRETLAALDQLVGAGLSRAGEQVQGSLEEIALSEAEWQARVLNSATRPWNLEFTVPSARTIRSVVVSRPFQGAVLKDWWGKVERSARFEIKRQIRMGIVQGETTQQIVRRVYGTSAAAFGDGSFAQVRRNVSATVRTAVGHVSNHARQGTYADNADLIKGILYVATLDNRTTLTCASLDGQVFPIDSGPRPPQHWQCRSTTSPVLRSWRELGIDLGDDPEGTRASMNGQVPASTTYGQWLKRQPHEVQEDVLGKTRARLFRSRKVSIERFVDDKRRPLTLKAFGLSEGAAIL